MTRPNLRIVQPEPAPRYNPSARGYHVAYHPGETNHCPGCGRVNWYVGRTSAECAWCATSVDLVARLREALIHCGRTAGAFLADEVSTGFLLDNVAAEVKGKITALLAENERIAGDLLAAQGARDKTLDRARYYD